MELVGGNLDVNEAEQKRPLLSVGDLNPRKKIRAMEGRMDRVMEIDLSVKLDEVENQEEGNLGNGKKLEAAMVLPLMNILCEFKDANVQCGGDDDNNKTGKDVHCEKSSSMASVSVGASTIEPQPQEGGSWPPSKAIQGSQNPAGENCTESTSATRKARVSVRARCEAPTPGQQFQLQRQSSINNSPLNMPTNTARAIQGALSQYSSQALIQNIITECGARSAGAGQHSLADTVSAATAAITSDPNFTAALANAITSLISQAGNQTQAAGDAFGGDQNQSFSAQRKWAESSLTDHHGGAASGCGNSYVNRSLHPTQSNVLFSAASVPFSTKQWSTASSERQNL